MFVFEKKIKMGNTVATDIVTNKWTNQMTSYTDIQYVTDSLFK